MGDDLGEVPRQIGEGMSGGWWFHVGTWECRREADTNGRPTYLVEQRGRRKVFVVLNPCGTMRYGTDDGRAIPRYVIDALETEASTPVV